MLPGLCGCMFVATVTTFSRSRVLRRRREDVFAVTGLDDADDVWPIVVELKDTHFPLTVRVQDIQVVNDPDDVGVCRVLIGVDARSKTVWKLTLSDLARGDRRWRSR